MFARVVVGTPRLACCIAAAWVACLAPVAWSQQETGRDEGSLGRDPRLTEGQIAPILEGLGDHRHRVATRVPMAQAFFDQGLRLAFAFNHPEALRAFKEAARRDPDCAMAYWGQALVLGPNLNLPMAPEKESEAHAAIEKAVALKSSASIPDRMYIAAMATRYSSEEEPDRRALNMAYAEAMKDLHARLPDDSDAATLYAAALMNLSRWNYWTKDGQARPNTPEIVSVLESVLERTPDHPGALHYYIHAVEASSHPERALESADRLGPLMPGAGHMVHMPSHIYARVGRYADASASNERAIEADENYIVQCSAQGIYPLNYYPHNIHFLNWTASIEGRGEVALATAQSIAAKVPRDSAQDETTWAQNFLATPIYTLARFGMWSEILARPRPDDEFPFLIGIWHYGRGLAHNASGRSEKARVEWAALEAIALSPAMAENSIRGEKASTILAIAVHALSGEIAAREGRYDDALGSLEKAVRIQDSMNYAEPPRWYYPVRQSLGAVLLEAGLPAEAEVVYWEDLRRNPENGWSLFGVIQSLEAQEKTGDLDQLRERFGAAWANADVRLSSSRSVER